MLYGLESGDAGPVWCSEGDSSSLLPLFLLQETPLPNQNFLEETLQAPLLASLTRFLCFGKIIPQVPMGTGQVGRLRRWFKILWEVRSAGAGLVDGWERGGVRSKITPEFPVLATGQMESSWGGRIISSLCVR